VGILILREDFERAIKADQAEGANTSKTGDKPKPSSTASAGSGAIRQFF
jgi:hypothetical protein